MIDEDSGTAPDMQQTPCGLQRAHRHRVHHARQGLNLDRRFPVLALTEPLSHFARFRNRIGEQLPGDQGHVGLGKRAFQKVDPARANGLDVLQPELTGFDKDVPSMTVVSG